MTRLAGGALRGGAAESAAHDSWHLAPPAGPDGPRSPLLNAHQRGALGSILPVAERAVRLAAAELASVDARAPAHDRAEAARRRRLRDAMEAFSQQIEELGVEYGLAYEARDWRVLLLGQIERAYQVLEDAAPERLVGYGAVSQEMRRTFGSAVVDLQLALRDMQALVHRLRPAAG